MILAWRNSLYISSLGNLYPISRTPPNTHYRRYRVEINKYPATLFTAFYLIPLMASTTARLRSSMQTTIKIIVLRNDAFFYCGPSIDNRGESYASAGEGRHMVYTTRETSKHMKSCKENAVNSYRAGSRKAKKKSTDLYTIC